MYCAFSTPHLDLFITEEFLARIFGSFGELADITVKRHSRSVTPPSHSGYAFVYFYNAAAAEAAVNYFQNPANALEDVRITATLTHKVYDDTSSNSPSPHSSISNSRHPTAPFSRNNQPHGFRYDDMPDGAMLAQKSGTGFRHQATFDHLQEFVEHTASAAHFQPSQRQLSYQGHPMHDERLSRPQSEFSGIENGSFYNKSSRLSSGQGFVPPRQMSRSGGFPGPEEIAQGDYLPFEMFDHSTSQKQLFFQKPSSLPVPPPLINLQQQRHPSFFSSSVSSLANTPMHSSSSTSLPTPTSRAALSDPFQTQQTSQVDHYWSQQLKHTSSLVDVTEDPSMPQQIRRSSRDMPGAPEDISGAPSRHENLQLDRLLSDATFQPDRSYM